MKLLRPQQGTMWVLAREPLTVKTLPQQLRAADVCISDLDDTDCNSPARMLARRAIGTHHWSPAYWDWGIQALTARKKKGQNSESKSWNLYVERFLSTAGAKLKVTEFFTPERIQSTLFPGVDAFYQRLSAKKVYVSRNIAEVVQCYAEELGFAEWHGEELLKRQAVEKYVTAHPEQQHYIVKGDSEEDFEMLDFLRHRQREKKVASVLGIYCAKNFFKEKHDFDVEIGRDYRGLVELLNAH